MRRMITPLSQQFGIIFEIKRDTARTFQDQSAEAAESCHVDKETSDRLESRSAAVSCWAVMW
jgi:hypothetical protein